MNISTLKQDIARVKTLLSSGNKEALLNMLTPFHTAYKDKITKRLDPWEQQIYINMFS